PCPLQPHRCGAARSGPPDCRGLRARRAGRAPRLDPMKLALDIHAPSTLWRGLPRARALARETIAACAAECGLDAGGDIEVSLCLTDDAEVRALNARWRGLDTPTNVLSFPAAIREGIDDR